jgi:two-component system cell cycle response regulator
MLEKELTAAGLAVLTARDGLEALEKALAEDVALVVLDVMMPRMNGYQACRLLKSEPLTRHLPVIILTSRDQAGDRYWGQETGADYYVTKDAEAGRVVELARRILAERGSAPTPAPPRQGHTSVDILSRVNTLLDRKLFEATVLSEIGRVTRNLVHFDEAFASVFALGARVVDFALGGMAFLEDGAVEVVLTQTRRVAPESLERARAWLLEALARERGSAAPLEAEFRVFPPPEGAVVEPALSDFSAVPVVSGQRLAAVLFLAGRSVSRVSAENAGFLQQVADQAHMVLANSRLFERVRNLSVRDSLTGLWNHRYAMEALRREGERCDRYPQPLSLLMVDIDLFKDVNDAHGHLAGDAVLREVARTLQAGTRGVDVLGRYGGEEFVLILPHTPREQALRTAERLRKGVEEAVVRVDEAEVRVTVSIGVATFPSPEVKAPADLLAAADAALYRAKDQGRNRVA